jgi:hypothetical protein
MLTPLTIKAVPVVIAGLIAITPINPQKQIDAIYAAKQKIVSIIEKEGTKSTINEQGQIVELPYKERITVKRPDESSNGTGGNIISKTVNRGINAIKSVYWWVRK